jgi:CheY-like chemotaxis protein
MSAPAPSAGPASAAPVRPVILVADDYPENRRLLYFYLRDRYEVVEASTAEEALELLRQQPVALAILDLNFCDGMSGIEAVETLRREPALARTRALALTAYAYPDDRARCLAAGFDDYLAKPVFKQALLAKLEELIGPPAQVPPPRPDHAGDGAGGAVGQVWITRGREG